MKTLFIIFLTASLSTTAFGQDENYQTHTVRRGESLELIAEKYGVNTEDIKKINPKLDVFYTGMTINVPVVRNSSRLIAQESNVYENNSSPMAGNSRAIDRGTANKSLDSSISEPQKENLFMQAAALEYEGKNKKALKYYRQLVKTTDDAEAWLRYGKCCYSAGKWKEAIKALESVPYKISATIEIINSAKETLELARVERENQIERRQGFWSELGQTLLATGAMAATAYAQAKYASESGSSSSNSSYSGVSSGYSSDSNSSNSKYSSSSSQRQSSGKVCRSCKGSGKCISCHGEGVRTDNLFGTGKDYSKKCGVCGGEGICGVCHGTGHQN